ncbi:MAG TPA: phospholipase D-like domain-containing protein [Sphingomonas sp.]|uniref:phospholipase D-like domain-containing protein n=1 Tax=Sphingomonas sp. TaxID=28214 RepID=UPI002ED80E19
MDQASHWRIEQADQFSVIVDAEDYFRTARHAMLNAKQRIMLVGWDFDARIELDHACSKDEGPRPVGEFIYWLVQRNPQLHVYLLRWDVGALKGLFRGITIFTVLKWMVHPRIHTKLDGHHPTGASHHQKVVVIDDCLAFCGGIDMTGDRWDTRSHLDKDPERVQPSGNPYKPWHDATSAATGPVAAALGHMARDRWVRAGGKPIAPVVGHEPCWPAHLRVDFETMPVRIARTVPRMRDQEPVHESEALFLEQIAAAKRHVYVESQYFASRRIAEAIAARLGEADGPEFVIINPLTAQGWLEPMAMDTARARLVTALWRRDRFQRLRLYHPYTAGGTPIYVHAKILIADDRVLRLGSSNMNNRSLRLDTECDLAIQADTATDRARVTAIRDDLIAEHLGVAPDVVEAAIARTGSLIAAIEGLRGEGRSLRAYEVPDLTAVETWLADNEVLDPEGPDEMFEALSARGLFRRLRRPGSKAPKMRLGR